MTEQTLILEDGPSITIRKPTEAEVVAYLDKRQIVEEGDRPSGDATDDGDRELVSCVTSPDQAGMLSLLEQYPLLNRDLRRAFMELGGDAVQMRRDDALITEAHRVAGSYLIAFSISEPATAPITVVLQKLSRFETKALEHEVRQAGRKGPIPSAMAKLARSHVVAPQAEVAAVRELLDRVPLLAPNLGLQLFLAARAKLKEAAGK